MWTNENRGRYDRSTLRYPSDVTDSEWDLIGPLIPPAKRGGNKWTVGVREIDLPPRKWTRVTTYAVAASCSLLIGEQ